MIKLSNGTMIDEVGYGTYLVCEETTPGRSKDIMIDAINLGYRYLDTAVFYFNEVEVGQAVRECGLKREDLFVVTKIWCDNLGYDKAKASIQGSLDRLDIGYADMVLIHWPLEFPGDPEWKEKIQGAWRAMEEFYDKGLVKNLGLSNFLPHHIMALMETAKVKPVINQLELHVGYMQQTAVDYCRKVGIVPQAWSPLGRRRLATFQPIIDMAKKYDVTPGDLLLRFLLQQDIAIVPKATSREHLIGNLHPAEFTISEEDMYFLLCMPSIGWSGEHPDIENVGIDDRYLV